MLINQRIKGGWLHGPGLNGQASVSQADIACSNGWVHVVSRVATAAAYVFPPPMKNIFQRLEPRGDGNR